MGTAPTTKGLPQGPFMYKVEPILDGRPYVASVTWPDDEIKGNDPSVRLDLQSEPARPVTLITTVVERTAEREKPQERARSSPRRSSMVSASLALLSGR